MNTVQVGCIAGLIVLEDIQTKKSRRKKRWWTHPTLSNRLSTGQFHIMFNKHKMYFEKFFQYYRMSVTSFDELLDLVRENVAKRDTVMRRSVDPTERLVVTLR